MCPASIFSPEAERFGRRVRAFAHAHQNPVVICSTGTRKDEVGRQHLAQNPEARGLFLILIGRAPAPAWQVKRNPRGAITEIARSPSTPYVNLSSRS